MHEQQFSGAREHSSSIDSFANEIRGKTADQIIAMGGEPATLNGKMSLLINEADARGLDTQVLQEVIRKLVH